MREQRLAGRLHHHITIEQPSTVPNGVGELVPAWTQYGKAYAEITPLRLSEQLTARQVNAEVDHRLRIRYLAGVTPKMRVTFDGRVFNIKGVADPDGRQRILELTVKELV